MPKNKFKNRASNIKRRKIDKKNRAHDNAFGFTQAKTIKEYEGYASQDSDDDLPQRTIVHNEQEEIVIVSEERPKAKTFDQLSQFSVLNLVSSSVTDPISTDPDNDLGFFFDTTPSSQPSPKPKEQRKDLIKQDCIFIESDQDDDVISIDPSNDLGFFIDTAPSSRFSHAPKKRQKILKDDSIYIESDPDDDDDDVISISSSEDIDVIHALSHWGSQNDLQFDEPVRAHRRSDHTDFALLESTFYQDIFTEQRSLLVEDTAKKLPTVLDTILNHFIRKDHVQTYSLFPLSHHGRTMIVPILAKLFQLTTREINNNKGHIELKKTLSTCIPSSFTDYKNQLQKKSKSKTKLSSYQKRVKKQQDKKLFRENESHGKEVASNSEPIPASNKGHRMLSAMGWKEGDAIGKDGIKEPIKAYMRATRRGLGA